MTHDDELVATDPRDRVARPEPGPQTVRDRLQRLVSARMADAVVDLFEVVDVDDGHPHEMIGFGEQHRPLQAVVETGPVGQLGERIVSCLMDERQFGFVALGDVEHRARDLVRVGSTNRSGLGKNPSRHAVRSHDPVRGFDVLATGRHHLGQPADSLEVVGVDVVEVDPSRRSQVDAEHPAQLVGTDDIAGGEVDLEAAQPRRGLGDGEMPTFGFDLLEKYDTLRDVTGDRGRADDLAGPRSDR